MKRTSLFLLGSFSLSWFGLLTWLYHMWSQSEAATGHGVPAFPLLTAGLAVVLLLLFLVLFSPHRLLIANVISLSLLSLILVRGYTSFASQRTTRLDIYKYRELGGKKHFEARYLYFCTSNAGLFLKYEHRIDFGRMANPNNYPDGVTFGWTQYPPNRYPQKRYPRAVHMTNWQHHYYPIPAIWGFEAAFAWHDAPKPDISNGMAHYAVVMPLWFPALFCLIAPGLWVMRTVRRQRRMKRGLCLKCGYDLRGSKGKCPECGTIVPSETANTRAESG